MARKRRRFTAEFKGPVALEALQERDSVQAIAARHELHPNQVAAWKRQLFDAVPEVFAKGAGKLAQEHEAKIRDLLRADSAYAREELMAWCKDNDVDFVIGLARNSRLVERIRWLLDDAAAEAERKGRPARRFTEFPYATLTSWSCERRVVAKAEHLADKANPRFVVTSLPADTFSARIVYERLYCARGNMENTIKEQQLDLFSDRTSATCFAANQLRLLFSAFASILFDALRQALHGTRLARATAGTLRLKLFKIGARVTVSVRRVKVAMDSAHPSAAAFARVHARLPG